MASVVSLLFIVSSVQFSFGESVSVASSYVEVTDTLTSATVSTIPLMYGNSVPEPYNHQDLVNTVTFYVGYTAGRTYQVKIKKTR